ncbi:MAG: PspC domain-containing protein [Paludibacteraceae bacterium]|nr:PspC domain-containing protein [Paludibacteraceae bacterium]
MKKTCTINLNSSVYNIDEDAYERLNSYLNDVRSRLDENEADEVMQDIEARVGELFTERLINSRNVVDVADVEAIIERLGSPDSFGPTVEQPSGKSKTSDLRRTLYRDTDHKMIGGVCSGIAWFIGWDTTWVRLFMVLLMCISSGTLIIIYAIFWLIVPEARTISQKLEMQGIEPSLKNISEYSRCNPQQEVCRQSNGTLLTCLKVCGYLLLIPLIMVVALVAVAVLLGCVVAFAALLDHNVPLSFPAVFTGIEWGYFALYCLIGLFVIVLPMVALCRYVVRKIRNDRSVIERRKVIGWTAAWIIALILVAGISAYYVRSGKFRNIVEHGVIANGVEDIVDDYSDVITEERLAGYKCRGIKASAGVTVSLLIDSLDYVEVTSPSATIRNVSVTFSDDSILCISPSGRMRSALVVVHMSRPLRSIDASSGADVEGTNLQSDSLMIRTSSGARIDLDNVNLGFVDAHASSGGLIDLSGQAAVVKSNTSSGGFVNTKKLNIR